MPKWRTPSYPLEIECAAATLEDLRMRAINGLYAIPHGGVEVGGVLFGSHAAGRVQVTECVAIPTEYLTGPSFRLSENDRAGLGGLLAETAREPVGWFHSHTRTGTPLRAHDLETYNEFFPRPWQVALVLRPENMGPVRGAFYFRDAGGAVSAEAVEFTLEPGFASFSATPDSLPGEGAEEGVEEAEDEPERPPLRCAAPLRKRVFLVLLAIALMVSALTGFVVGRG